MAGRRPGHLPMASKQYYGGKKPEHGYDAVDEEQIQVF
jgi:hypothetical protein